MYLCILVLNLFNRCGKTTLCQLFASILGRKLYSINCHMNTEAADFLGGLRPARRRQDQDDAITDEVSVYVCVTVSVCDFCMCFLFLTFHTIIGGIRS